MSASTVVDERQRSAAVDRVRGLAVACMVVDHLCLVLGGPAILRLTIGRLAMPLFFVTAGRCAGRLRPRHAVVFVIGMALPALVPWVDAPNVLVWWVWGSVALAGCRLAGVSPALLGVVVLGVLANGWSGSWPHSYDPYALLGLMVLGALMPLTWWAWGDRLRTGGVLDWLGRHALPFYVGHLLVLQLVGGL